MHRFVVLLCLLLLFSRDISAQLDTIHWLPPLHARGEEGPQYLYLSTPETVPFVVTIRDGSGALVATANLSNTQPYSLSLGSTNFTKMLVSEDSLHIALSKKGLVMEGAKPFYAYLRVHSNSQFQAADLTCKGRAAAGTTFRIGHLLQGFHSPSKRCNFFSVMATQDSTQINVSEWEAGTVFRVKSQNAMLGSPHIQVLQKGQTVVFAQYSALTQQESAINGFMGSLVTATKPIVINTGSWTGSPVSYSSNDVGIDQIVPIELVGDEYILCRGNGSEILERPILVAHYPNTDVFINGDKVPHTRLQPGDWIALQTSLYTPQGNMHIMSSQPIYVYQMVGGAPSGSDESRTAGLMFVPPISCGIPSIVDNIYLPNQIGNMDFEGGMMITAMRDSLVLLTVDGVNKPTGPASSVLGNPDFVTYRPITLFSKFTSVQTVSVKAQGAVQVALFGRDEPASFAGFFSGFTVTDRPKLTLTRLGDGVCPDTLVASGRFDGVQWMYGDSIIQYGTDTTLITYAPGQYSAVGYLGVCRRTNFAADTIDMTFMSPLFEYAYQEPSCFGFTDGSITFGTPLGGIAPYQYSVDQGKTFQSQPVVLGLGAANYALVARDSTGCYNRPIDVTITQPDSFIVKLQTTDLIDPLFPDQLVRFRAVPSGPVSTSQWSPNGSSSCTNCLTYAWVADQSRWIEVTVTDTAGCPATDRVYVNVTPNIYAPNVINPASETGNASFILYSKDVLVIKRLRIFDRWGELVYEEADLSTNDLSRGWNGLTPNGRALPQGVYVWMAEVERTPGNISVLRGDVTLVMNK
jgi:IgGFc binding protein/CHU_C Type IX secretion signal domain/SprB repeat